MMFQNHQRLIFDHVLFEVFTLRRTLQAGHLIELGLLERREELLDIVDPLESYEVAFQVVEVAHVPIYRHR